MSPLDNKHNYDAVLSTRKAMIVPAPPELQSIFEKLEIVTGWESKIVQLMQKSNPPVNLLPPLIYVLYIGRNLVQVVSCKLPDALMNEESDLKKILKSMSHFGNTRNYYYKTECGQFSYRETWRRHHVVGISHLPTNSILNNRRLLVGGRAIIARKKIRFKKLMVKLKMGILEKPLLTKKEFPMKRQAQCIILLSAVSFISNISESRAQLSLMAHSNLIFVDYKEGYVNDSGTTELNLLPVAIGFEARVKKFAFSFSGEAFSPPTVDLILTGRVSLTIYPFKAGPIEPFVTANIGLATGEDISYDETSGYGGGLACQVSRKVQLFAQVRRLHFFFYEDIQLKNDVYEIAVGPKFSF